MNDPYDLMSRPADLALLRARARMGFVEDPDELARLEAVDREWVRRRSFSASGEITPA